MGTGAQEEKSAFSDKEAKMARDRAIEKIKKLMQDAGIPDKSNELDQAGIIYDNVKTFLENTGFNPDALPATRY